MKKCPYCAEDIQDAAIKCKHCGEMLDSTTEQPREIDLTEEPARRMSRHNSTNHIAKDKAVQKEDSPNTVLGIVTLCLVFPIVMIIFAAVYHTSFPAMIVLLPVEGVVVWLTWIFLRKVLQWSSVWPLLFLPTGLGLAAGWYAAFRMSSAGLLSEIWLNSEKTLGRSLTEAESSDLYSRTLASEEFWSIVHQKASIPAIGVFLVIFITIVVMIPGPTGSEENDKRSQAMNDQETTSLEGNSSTKPSSFLGIGMIASATGVAILFTDYPNFGYKIGSSLGQILGSAILALPIFLIWRYATKPGRMAELSRSFNVFATILVVTWFLLFVIAKNLLPSFAA